MPPSAGRPVPPRRVLLLVPDLFGPPGGIARHSRMVARALADLGARTVIVALHDRPPHPCVSVPAYSSHRPCSGSRAWFVLTCTASARLRPHLVIATHVHLAAPAWLTARACSASAVAFIHGIESWTPLSPLRRRALRRLDRIIAVSQFTATRAAAANGLDAARIRVLPSPLDPEFPIAPSGRRHGTHLLTVGRIDAAEAYKGHREVLAILPRLRRRFPDLQYDIVGDGSGRANLERLASELGLNGSVRFHGTVPEPALAELYASADLFVMPSRGEGFGLVFLEAMAHSLPIIAGTTDAAGEVVRHGKTGLLVDPSSPDDLETAVTDLLTHPERRARMGVAARDRVETEFRYERFRDRLQEQLRDL